MNPVPLFLIIVTLPLLLGGCGEKPNLKHENLKYEIKGGKVTITGCDYGASGKLVIPATIEGNPVTSIGNEAFLACTSLTSITIGNGVTSIGTAAFYRCGGVKSITIPDSVTSIGDGAFANCTSLTSITIPDGVTSIGHAAFAACESMNAVTFLGDAPKVKSNDTFKYSSSIIYRKPEAKGWGDTFGGRPVKLISEKP